MGAKPMPTEILAKFRPGKLVATPAVMRKVDPDYAMASLVQHLQAKWGLCDPEDWKANDEALKHGGRLLSVYPLPNEPEVFWIITEHDRSVTTILLPSDY
jgi:hypothetical protein